MSHLLGVVMVSGYVVRDMAARTALKWLRRRAMELIPIRSASKMLSGLFCMSFWSSSVTHLANRSVRWTLTSALSDSKAPGLFGSRAVVVMNAGPK